MYSITIFSDDRVLAGNVEHTDRYGSTSYIARIWDVRHWDSNDNTQYPPLIEAKSFGNDVMAENWMLDKLECPLFTLLSK